MVVVVNMLTLAVGGGSGGVGTGRAGTAGDGVAADCIRLVTAQSPTGINTTAVIPYANNLA